MAMSYGELMEAALQLSPLDRRLFAKELMLVTEHIDADKLLDEQPLSPEWKTEIERRVARIESGEAVLIDGETAMRKIAEKFGFPPYGHDRRAKA